MLQAEQEIARAGRRRIDIAQVGVDATKAGTCEIGHRGLCLLLLWSHAI
jgi:hypothetical protein